MFEQLFYDMRRALDLGDQMDRIQAHTYDTLSTIHRRVCERVESARPALTGQYADRIFSKHRAIAVRSRWYLQQLSSNRAEVSGWKQGLRQEADDHEHAVRTAHSSVPAFVWDFLEPYCERVSFQQAVRFGSDGLEHPAETWRRLVPAPQPAAPQSALDALGQAVTGAAGWLLSRFEQLGLDYSEVEGAIAAYGDRLFAALDWTQARVGSYMFLGINLPCCNKSLPVTTDGKPELYQVPHTNHPPRNLQQLYQMIDYQYHRHGGHAPIGITPVGNNTLLVTLAGVEQISTQTNTIKNAVITSAQTNNSPQNDPYGKDVEAALDDYIKAHTPPLKQPVRVIIAGHSYGGIVGQELAAHNTDPRFQVTDVTTFGSPEIGPHSKDVQYTQFSTEHDVVPLLSSDEADPDVQKYLNEMSGDITTPYPEKYEAAVALTTSDILNISAKGDPQAIGQWTAVDGNPPEIVLTDQASVTTTDRNAAHGAYLNSTELGSIPIPTSWNLSDAQWGATQYYTVTQSGDVNNLYDPHVQQGLSNLQPTPSPLPSPVPVPAPVPATTPGPGQK